MKKLFLLIALLLIAGVAHSAAIQESIGITQGIPTGPEIWLMDVYNNSASTVSAGDLVVWATSSSTGDNDPYINTTTTENTTLVAGIVYPSDIATKSIGTIAIKATGISVNTLSNFTGAANTPLCSSNTAGKAGPCGDTAAGTRVGFMNAAASGGTAVATVDVK